MNRVAYLLAFLLGLGAAVGCERCEGQPSTARAADMAPACKPCAWDGFGACPVSACYQGCCQ